MQVFRPKLRYLEENSHLLEAERFGPAPDDTTRRFGT